MSHAGSPSSRVGRKRGGRRVARLPARRAAPRDLAGELEHLRPEQDQPPGQRGAIGGGIVDDAM